VRYTEVTGRLIRTRGLTSLHFSLGSYVAAFLSRRSTACGSRLLSGHLSLIASSLIASLSHRISLSSHLSLIPSLSHHISVSSHLLSSHLCLVAPSLIASVSHRISLSSHLSLIASLSHHICLLLILCCPTQRLLRCSLKPRARSTCQQSLHRCKISEPNG